MDDNVYENLVVENLDESLRVDLIKNGIFRLLGDIYNTEIDNLLEDLYILDLFIKNEESNPDKVVYRIIGSPGGEVESALAMYDILRSYSEKSGKPIVIEVYGNAYSAACMIILQAGDIRKATKNCTFLLHEGSLFKFGFEKPSELHDSKIYMDMLDEKIYKVLADRCGKSSKEVKDFIDRKEIWFDVNQALEWNLIDGIL